MPAVSNWFVRTGSGVALDTFVTGIVRTVKQTMIDRKLGSLTKVDMQAVERELRRALDL
jgi:hypothetical protein